MSEDIASIGFKVDTSDIERGNVALDVLASKGEAVDKSVSQVEAAASKTSKSLDNLGRSVHGVNMGGLGGAAQTAATGMGAAGKAAESGATGVKRMADVLGGFSRDTSKAADALGLYASSTKNAIDHQRELERILDRANPASAAARQLSEEVQTLNRALREGAIGNDTYRASMRNAFDEAEKAAGGVSKVGTAASMVTGLLTKLAGAAAVAFSFGKFISETIAAEQAQAQLQAVLKSTGESAGWTSDQLNAMAQGLASKSIFSVDQIKAAETRLLSYTGIVGQQFPRAMQAVIDMSSRMGMDVTSAAEQIGRALDIPSQGLTALTRQGFRFTEEQKEMVKQLEETGRVAEAQAIVLSAVESSYGGAAEAARGTFGGALKELQNSINDLMTGEGAGIEGMTRGVNNLRDALRSEGTKQAFQTFIGWIADVSAKAIAGAANLIAFINANNKLAMLTGNDPYGQSKSKLEDKSREIAQLTNEYERLSNQVADGINVEVNGRALEGVRNTIIQVQREAQAAKNGMLSLASAGIAQPEASYGSPSQIATANAAAEAASKAEASRTAARIDAMNKLLGINSSYQDELKKNQANLASGAITQEEYVASLKKLATETWAATDAGKAAAEASKAAAEASKAGTKARDEAAKATQREAEAYGSFLSSVQSKIAAIDLEIAGGSKLTESQKLQLRLEKQIADGKMNASRAAQEATKASLAELSAKEAALKLQTEQNKAMEEGAKAYDAYVKTQQQQAVASAEKNDAMRLEIEAMGLSKRELLNLNRSRLDEQIVVLQAKHSQLTLAGARDDETKAIRDQIKALEERKNLLGQQFDKQAMLDAQQEITDTWTSIDRTAHDVFVNIFEDGAGTFKRLGQTLKAALLDMLYQMTVKRWIINIGASMGATGGIFAAGNAVAGQGGGGSAYGAAHLIGNWLGLTTGAASGTVAAANVVGAAGGDALGTLISLNGGWGTMGGGGSAGGLLNLGSSLFGAGGMTGSLMAGAGWLTGATTFGGALGAAGSLIGTGTAAGIGSGLAMGAGALAPILAPLALLAMSGAFSRKHEQHNLQGTFGGATGFEGNWHDYYRGGLFRSSKTVDTPIEAGFLKQLRDAWKTQESAVQDYAETLGLATGKIDGFTYSINLKLKDIDAKDENAYQQAVMQRVSEAIRAGSNEMAQMLIGSWESVTETVARTVQTYGDEGGFGEIEETIERRTYKPSEFARDGEQAIDTLTRLATSLQGVNGMFDTLGLTLYEASLKGGDMASELADAAGGLDKLQASTATYFQNFYTGSEQHATALRQVREQFDRLDVAMPATRDEFRSLVEGLDLTTEEGRKLFAGLMDISGAFAAVTPQLFQAGQTLSDAITQGLLGTYDGDSLGAYMAQTVSDGIYNAIAGYFAQQITDIVVSGVVDPIIQAAITGASITGAVSQATIDEMVAHANAVAAAAAAVLNDPAFQEAMASIGKAVGSISLPAQHVAPSISTYTRAVEDSGTAASRAADQISDAWKSIGDTLMDEVNRIRGVLNESAGQGVDYWQAQLAIAKAQAMAGDQDAARSLAGISQNLLRAGEESAGSMLELQRLRAQVAQSLQGVAGYAYGLAGIGVQQPTATPPVWTGTTSDGAQYAKPYSPPHTGPEAITNAPIESMAWVAPPTYSAPSGSSNADVVAELRALRQAIETADRTDADLQRRTVRVLERFDTLGMPPARSEA